MGYLPPPPPPSGIISLPSGVTFSPVEIAAIKDAWMKPRAYVTMPTTTIWVGRPPRAADPRGWTERNVVALGYGLIASIGAFLVFVAWAVAT